MNTSYSYSVSPEVKAAAPEYALLAIEAAVDNSSTTDALWNEITACCENMARTMSLEEVRLNPAISATRNAYKALGKDPNRYRPSADALSRRAVKGMELYRTLTVIDLINLISLQTGISIGGFDADKIQGRTLTLGRGEAGEPFEAIGRGELNIEGLPVWRDDVGGIGTPTSDNTRTQLSPETSRLLMLVNCFHGPKREQLESLASGIKEFLVKFASAHDIRMDLIIGGE